jgi:tetratricopeptide (TPR) repeat protein
MSMGDTQQALNLYKQAVRTYPRNVNIWNNVCWYGSVYGHVADVLYACDQAISLDPDNPSVRDSRGLVRALAGDYQGAIEDFTYFAEKSSVDERQVRLRILWIAQLKAGNNPFNQNTLNLLIRLYQDSLNPEVWDQLISS